MWLPGFFFTFCLLQLKVYQQHHRRHHFKRNNLQNQWLPNTFLPHCITIQTLHEQDILKSLFQQIHFAWADDELCVPDPEPASATPW